MTKEEIVIKLIELGLTFDDIINYVDVDDLCKENYSVEDLKEIVEDALFIKAEQFTNSTFNDLVL